MLSIENRSAWIVQWLKDRRDATPLNLRPHILPYRWSAEKVFDFMRCVYWNSPLTNPCGAMLQINAKKPLGIFQTNQGSRLLYGDSTRLVAWYVNDLSFKTISPNKILMEWTASGGGDLNQNPIGQTRKRQFEYSIGSLFTH